MLAIDKNLTKENICMKRKPPIIFAILCLVLVTSIVFFIYSIVDINRFLNELANSPGTSGSDYFGVGMGYGICLFALSVLGLILSWKCKKQLHMKSMRYICIIGTVVFTLLLIASAFLFYM